MLPFSWKGRRKITENFSLSAECIYHLRASNKFLKCWSPKIAGVFLLLISSYVSCLRGNKTSEKRMHWIWHYKFNGFNLNKNCWYVFVKSPLHEELRNSFMLRTGSLQDWQFLWTDSHLSFISNKFIYVNMTTFSSEAHLARILYTRQANWNELLFRITDFLAR
jgi:hypothetical protein